MEGSRHALLAALLCLLTGCATVAPESVTLSRTIGEDLATVHGSYRELIAAHFDHLEGEVDQFIDNRWKPVFLKNFIRDGGLVDAARMSDPNAVLERVSYWSELAIDEIEAKRAELKTPLAAQKRELLASVDSAMAQLRAANAALTAHLASVTKVQDTQGDLLAAAKLPDLRRLIQDQLVRASGLAQDGIEAVAKAEGIALRATELRGRRSGAAE